MSAETMQIRLERDELIVLDQSPFALPEGDDRAFLMGQQIGRGHKNISFAPLTSRVSGHRTIPHLTHNQGEERLAELLGDFTTRATMWLTRQLPGYARHWQLDRASLRPEEEATRRLRHSARNDLLHIDAFPNRPSLGRRLLRLYVNIDPDEPRVWATSETFPKLLARYTTRHRLPTLNVKEWCRPQLGLRNVFRPGTSAYDLQMQRMHHYLKQDDDFQERAAKRLWHLPPCSVWVLFADSLSHAVLRGRCALECSLFVPVEALSDGTESPLTLLSHAGREGLAA